MTSPPLDDRRSIADGSISRRWSMLCGSVWPIVFIGLVLAAICSGFRLLLLLVCMQDVSSPIMAAQALAVGFRVDLIDIGYLLIVPVLILCINGRQAFGHWNKALICYAAILYEPWTSTDKIAYDCT